MAIQKHLNQDERFIIEHSIDNSLSFKAIGRELNRDCTTISKEVKIHRVFKKTGSFCGPFNNCLLRFECDIRHLCKISNTGCNKYCRFCRHCITNCVGMPTS